MDDQQVATAESTFHSLALQWKINDFESKLTGHDSAMRSPIYPHDRDIMWSWFFALQVYGDNHEEQPGEISIFLRFITSEVRGAKRIRDVTMSILDRSGIAVYKKTRAGDLNFKKEPLRCNYFGYPSFITVDELVRRKDQLLPDGCLTIRCSGVMVSEVVNRWSWQYRCDVPNPCLGTDLEEMRQYGLLTDVVIICQDRRIHAHKFVMSARSPVFRAMFQHGTLEGFSGEVHISDVRHEVVEEMVRFMYTDDSSNLDTLSAELLVAANKYDLPRLKVLCEQHLCRNLSPDNVVEMLKLSQMHEAHQMKMAASKFIAANLPIMSVATLVSLTPDMLDKSVLS